MSNSSGIISSAQPIVPVIAAAVVPTEANHYVNTVSMSVSKRVTYVAALKNAEVAKAASFASKATIAANAFKQLEVAESKLGSAQKALSELQGSSGYASDHIAQCQKELDEATAIFAAMDVGVDDALPAVPVSMPVVPPSQLASIRGPIVQPTVQTITTGVTMLPAVSAATPASMKVARELAAAKARLADLQRALVEAIAASTQAGSREAVVQQQVEAAVKERDIASSKSQMAQRCEG